MSVLHEIITRVRGHTEHDAVCTRCGEGYEQVEPFCKRCGYKTVEEVNNNE